MPLEFALRPRFDLERPTRKRRLSWVRLPPFALPLGAYWLILAGVTHTLIRSASADASGQADSGEVAGATRVADPAQDTLAEPGVRSSAIPSTSSAFAPRTALPEVRLEPDPEPLPLSQLLDQQLRDQQLRDQQLRDNHEAHEEQPRSEQSLQAAARARGSAADRHRVPEEAPLAPREPLAPEPAAPPERNEARSQLRSETPRGRVPEERSSETSTASLPSCESAAETANQTMDLRSARGAPDLTRNAFAAVLENGAYLSHCAPNPRTALEICAAVQNGKVVGVSVTTEPRNPALSACVRRAVAGLRFPRSAQLDITRTRFAPAL